MSECRLEGTSVKGDGKELLEQCFTKNGSGLNELFQKAYDVSREHFSNSIHFYIPGMVHYETSFYQPMEAHFPGISVTGRFCHLNCEHCSGKLLESMIPATTPQELFEVCRRIKNQGSIGCLISGGSLSNGKVPLKEFIPAISQVKQALGLQVVVHTGLIDASLAEALADANIDGAMIDIIGSNNTMKEVYHLDEDVSSFDHSLSLLEDNGIPTVPHIVVGIHFGKLKGEKKAIEIISRHNPAAVVIVAFTPLGNTKMEYASPPSPLEIARVVLASKLMMPEKPILLGCARPRGLDKVETDILAMKAGVNGIAYPSEEAHEYAKKLGLNVKLHEKCCSLIWKDMKSA